MKDFKEIKEIDTSGQHTHFYIYDSIKPGSRIKFNVTEQHRKNAGLSQVRHKRGNLTAKKKLEQIVQRLKEKRNGQNK